LRPENLLYDAKSETLIIADFGIAHFTADSIKANVNTQKGAWLAITCRNEIVDSTIAISRSDKANVQLFDADSGALTISARRGFDDPFLKLFAHVGDDASAYAAAVRTAERVVVDGVTCGET
jgi:hypothetical protein